MALTMSGSRSTAKLPPVPNYAAPVPPMPPSLAEAPVWFGEEPLSESDDESGSDISDYEEVHHEMPTEAQVSVSLEVASTIIGLQSGRTYAYEAKLPPMPTPLLPPEDDVTGGYDPFRPSLSPTSPKPQDRNTLDLSNIKDWTPVNLLQAYFRAQLTRGWFSRRKTMIFHRNNVAREILSTEQTYVLNLKIVLGIYMAPLQAGLKGDHPLITREEYNQLFPRLDIIIGLNTEMLSAIHDRVAKWTDRTCLADIFLRMAAFFKMYTEYCSKYEAAAAMYRQLVKTREEFAKFLSQVENLQDIHGLDLPSFLILPCQRIPRYLMLITELNKWTWPDHPDKANLDQAVNQWQEVVTHVNDSMDEAARMNELLQIEHKFNNQLNLVVPHRKFIKQGPIHKITSRIVVTPTYFLFTDILVYGYPSADDTQVKYKGTISLSTTWVRDLEDSEDFKFGFQLVTPDKAYTFYLDNAKEKRGWVASIEACINRLVAIDPMLVTKRATQVKKTQRVGQQIWKLFTKDVDAFAFSNIDEDAIQEQHRSHLNSTLGTLKSSNRRTLQPVRAGGILELNWSDDPGKTKKHRKEKTVITTGKPNGSDDYKTALEPTVSDQPSAQKLHQGKNGGIRQGNSRQHDPNRPHAEHLISLEDDPLDQHTPRLARPAPSTRVTHSKLVGDDKLYSPMLARNASNRAYGSIQADGDLNGEENSCCACSIM